MRSLVAGIVLAAGSSRRMGRGKLLLPWRGRPVLEHVLRAARASGVGPRILVLGHESAAIRAGLDTLYEEPGRQYSALQPTWCSDCWLPSH